MIPIKTLIEVLKEILLDVSLEFTPDQPDDKDSDKTDNENDDDDDNDDESNKKVVVVDKKKKKKNKEKEDEDVTDKKEDQRRTGGIKILSVASSKTLMILLKLEAKQFARFKCKVPKLRIGVNLNMLNKLIKTIDKDHTLTFQYDDANRETLYIHIENQDKTCTTTYDLDLLDLNAEDIKVPPTAFDAVITMSSAEFHKLCREMNSIAEHVDIKCSPNNVIMSCKGDCAGRTTTYTSGKQVSIKFTPSEQNKANIVQGVFELKNLVLFTKCSNLCDDIQIYMKNNYPLVIKYTIATLGKLMLCISPVNDKDDNHDNMDNIDDIEDEDENLYGKPQIKYKNLDNDDDDDN